MTTLGNDPDDWYSGRQQSTSDSGATASHCPRCAMVGAAFRAQSDSARFILHLLWLRWLVKRERTGPGWTKVHRIKRKQKR